MSSYRLRHYFDRLQQLLRVETYYPLRRLCKGELSAPRRDLYMIHIPKTAGTSVHRALGIRDRGHHAVSEIVPRQLRNANLIVFAMRDPFDRLVSMHGYLKSIREKGAVRGHPVVNFAHRQSFANYVVDPRLAALVRNHYFYRTQFAYLKGIESYRDKLVALRSEHLAEDMARSFGVTPPRLNRTLTPPPETADTTETRAAVRALYRDDYERLPQLLDACGIERPDWMT